MARDGTIDGEARRAQLLELVSRNGSVQLNSAAVQLRVSPMTVRRDLDELETCGLVRRVRGGAVLADQPQPFETRRVSHARAKAAIAAKALTLAPTSGSIALDASTTTGELARLLRNQTQVTVVTNSYDNFAVVREGNVRSLLIGGEAERATGSLVGPLAYESIRTMYYQVFFTSATAVDAEGTSEVSLAEVHPKSAFAEQSDKLVLCVDSSKIGHRSVAMGFALDRFMAVVTELDPSDPRLDGIRDRVTLI